MLQFFTYCKDSKAKQKLPQRPQNVEGKGLQLSNTKSGLHNISCVPKKVLSFVRSQAFLLLRKSSRTERPVHRSPHATEDTLRALQARPADSCHHPAESRRDAVSPLSMWP